MQNKKPEIVEVQPEENALILRANEIKAEAWKRAEEEAKEQSEKTGRHLKVAMSIIEDPEERIIVNASDRLAAKYQVEKGLPVLPVLIPHVETQFNEFSRTASSFHQYQKEGRGQLSQMALVDVFLERVPVRRQDGVLYVWTGKHFHRASDGELRGLVGEVLREELRYSNASAMIGSILSLLQSERRILEESDLQPRGISLHNGVLDFMSSRLQRATPDIFNTYFLDAYWYGNVPSPTFQTFLWTISGGNSLLAQRIMEAIGFLLAPGNEAKRFVLLQGVPNSGKSVIGNLVQTFFLPGDVAGLPLHQFGDRFAMSAIAGRHLNVSMDLPSGVIDARAAATIKQITGDDLVYVEGKGKEGCGRHIHCKFLLGSNHPVELKKRDEAFVERILLVPFHIAIPESQRDTGLLDKLRQEKSGILCQCLMAYREVVRHNYCFSGENEFGFRLEEIVLPEQPTNYLALFVSQCCQLLPEVFTPTEVLHLAFMDFCQEIGCQTIRDRSAFSRALKMQLDKQIEPLKKRVNGDAMNGYIGIRLKA